MPTKKPAPSIYQLKITLTEIRFPIWRRIQVPGTMRFCCLHDVIQTVMGWTDSHLHRFEKDGKYWGVPEYDDSEELEVMDESKVPVGGVLKIAGDSLAYVYDFSDNWRHEVTLEEIVLSGGPNGPVCLAGERSCPPEDIGGTDGYEQFLEIIFEPGHEDYVRYREWVGNPIHAEEFDLDAVNQKLLNMRWPVRHSRQMLTTHTG